MERPENQLIFNLFARTLRGASLRQCCIREKSAPASHEIKQEDNPGPLTGLRELSSLFPAGALPRWREISAMTPSGMSVRFWRDAFAIIQRILRQEPR